MDDLRAAPKLDRLATLTRPAAGRRVGGIWEPGEPEAAVLWVRLVELDAERDLTAEGARAAGSVKLLARYDATVIAEATFTGWELSIDGERFQLVSAEEWPGSRREYMTIIATRST